MNSKKYNPETYWDEVAKHISERKDIKLIAGDDEPFYRYKRNKFLTLLDEMDIKDKSVLEIGSGPGGNLKYLLNKKPSKISGTDISEKMIQLSKELLSSPIVELKKTNGTSLPFNSDSYDIVFTATVLQHNVDEENLKKLILEICRISKSDIYIYERIEKTITGHDSNLGRPIEYYAALFSENGFRLKQTTFLNIDVSYLVCGAIRKVLNNNNRKEGEPLTKVSILIENILLPFTSMLDKLVSRKRDLAMLHFIKQSFSNA
ncbi:MAG: class I SAM-dependent methyltransferase [Chitinophagaceae bacterium]|nr:class I SAM-dependent methyltransferase [Chitinophagaceae bacterium]